MGWWSEEVMGGDPPYNILGEICENLGFNRFKGEKERKIPAKLIRDRQDEVLELAIQSANEYGHSLFDEYQPLARQVVGHMFLEAKVKMRPRVKREVLWGCDNDQWAKKDKVRKKHIDEFRKRIEKEC